MSSEIGGLAGFPGGFIVTAFDLLALCTALGILGLRKWVVSDGAAFPSALWRLLGMALLVLTVTSVADLLRRGADMSGEPLAAWTSYVGPLLSQTHYGRVWLLRPAALLLLWLGWLAGRKGRHAGGHGRLSAWLALAAVLAASRSLSGHAADWGDFTLPALMDWLHLVAVGLWGGSLVALTLTGFDAFRAARSTGESASDRRHAVARMASRWSTLAAASLAVVAVTGLYNAWLEVGRLSALWETGYGRVLLAKLALVAVIVMLGAANRYIGVPALRAWAAGNAKGDAALAGFIRRAWIEGVLMMVTVATVAVLLGQAPGRHTHDVPAADDMPAGHHHHHGDASK